MAYMVNIIRASQEFEGATWAAYDAAFRRQAAATGMVEDKHVTIYHMLHGQHSLLPTL